MREGTQGKGQLISKCLFGGFNFFQKTNKNKSTWGVIEVKSNLFFRYLEEIDDPKNHFEINWPLITFQKDSRLEWKKTW